jgi:calmodulin
VMSKKVSATYTAEQVKHSFRAFESGSQPGYVKADAIVRALCTYGVDKMTEEQALDLVSQLEVGPDGLVNYEEYVNIMMSS